MGARGRRLKSWCTPLASLSLGALYSTHRCRLPSSLSAVSFDPARAVARPLPWPAPCTFPVNLYLGAALHFSRQPCLYTHVPLRLAESKASCETRLCPSALALLATRCPHAHAFATPSRLAWSWANGVGKGFPVSHGAPCHRRPREQESKMSAVTTRALAAEGIDQRFVLLACDRGRSAPPDQS